MAWPASVVLQGERGRLLVSRTFWQAEDFLKQFISCHGVIVLALLTCGLDAGASFRIGGGHVLPDTGGHIRSFAPTACQDTPVLGTTATTK